MKNQFTCFLILSLFCAVPAMAQNDLLVGSHYIVFTSNQPSFGDSATIAYNANGQTIDRITWKLESGNWNFYTRTHDHTYDANGKILHSINQVWDTGNTWINSAQNTYTYDAAGNQLSFLTEKWDASNGWINFQLRTTTYNAEGNPISFFLEKWDGASWVQQSTTTWEYDAAGNVLIETKGNYRTVCGYNAEGLLETSTSQQFISGDWKNLTTILYLYWPGSAYQATSTTSYWMNGAWAPGSRDSYWYDANWNLLETINEGVVNAIWQNKLRTAYTYNGSGAEEQVLVQEWDGANWENVKLETSSYDANGDLVYWTFEIWEAGQWTNNFRQFSAFDAHSNFTEGKFEEWNGASWQLSSYTRNHYLWLVSTQHLTRAAFDLFPNPASNLVTVQGAGFHHAILYDAEGQMMWTQNLQNQAQETLQLGRLSDGNYFLQLISKNGKTASKVLQIKH